MNIKEIKLEKKMLPCLRCGRRFLTDKSHRFCRRCRIAIQRLNYRAPRSVDTQDARHLLMKLRDLDS